MKSQLDAFCFKAAVLFSRHKDNKSGCVLAALLFYFLSSTLILGKIATKEFKKF